jgi:O-antigen ligase
MEPRSFASSSRTQLMGVADLAAVAVAVMLPWSTSGAAILIAIWLVVVIPTFDVPIIRESFAKPAAEKSAGELPVLLWALSALGMLWADVGWSERLAGAGAFAKLLAIPLLLAQFYCSNAGKWVLLGFLASATALLLVSWGLVLLPGLPWRGRSPGVPVKDYLAQSGIFVLCAVVLLHFALQSRTGDRRLALSLLLLSGLFVANVGYVATARTAIAVFAVLLLALAMWHFGWKGIAGALAILGLLGALLWTSSNHFRNEFLGTLQGAKGVGTNYVSISTGRRLEIWRKSVELIIRAPLIGHGAGSMSRLFAPRAEQGAATGAVATINPHNEIFRVGIQTGLLGIGVLIAMWISHLLLFRQSRSIGWIGTAIVTQNIVSSMLNSHLSDFTQGWLYVFGVGVVGGMALRERKSLHAAVLDRREKIKAG